jgi:hypothetical protein
MKCSGFYPEEKVWLNTDLRIGTLPSLEEALALIDELLCDFNFEGSDKATAVALLLQPFMRLLIHGPTPLFVIESPMFGSGKSLLAEVLNILVTGESLSPITANENEAEFKKQITSSLLACRPVICLDNWSEKKRFGSAAFASLITSERYSDRLLGQSLELDLRNDRTWILTGVNPRFEREFHRRYVRVRIDPGVPEPWNRKDFRHPELRGWVKENREELVGAILTVIDSWISHGSKPFEGANGGSFVDWSKKVGGALEHCGFENIFVSTEETYTPDESDTEFSKMGEFVEAWKKEGGKWSKAGELASFANRNQLFYAGQGDLMTASRMSGLLRQYSGRFFGGVKLLSRKDPHTKNSEYGLG